MRVKSASSSFDLNNRIETILLSLLLLFLPTQLGKHFWPDFSLVLGLRIDYLSPTLYLTDILTVLLFMVYFVNRIRKHNTIHFSGVKHSLLFLLSSFVLSYLVLINAYSQNPLNAFIHLLKLLECIFLSYYIATSLSRKKAFEQLLVCLSLGALFSACLAISQFLYQGSLGGLFYYVGERAFNAQTPGIANASINGELLLRPYGTFPHPNVLAGYLLGVFVLLLSAFSQVTSRQKKMLFGITLLVGSSALLLTFSRIAIALWLVVLFSSILIACKNLFLRSSLFIGALLLGAVLVFFTPLGGRFMETRFTEESVIQREQLMNASLQIIRSHPLGVGLGNFLPALSKLSADSYSSSFLQPVHNIFLLIAGEAGLFGFVCFIAMLFATYRNVFYNRNSRRLVAPGITLFLLLLIGLFDHYLLTVQQGQLFFAIIIGLCWTSLGKNNSSR